MAYYLLKVMQSRRELYVYNYVDFQRNINREWIRIEQVWPVKRQIIHRCVLITSWHDNLILLKTHPFVCNSKNLTEIQRCGKRFVCENAHRR